MRAPAAVVLSLAFALALAPAAASGCVPDSHTPDIDTGPLPTGEHYYIMNDCPETGVQPPHDACLMYPVCCWWFYEETNAIEGLQRNDEIFDNTCNGMIPADTIFF